MWRHPYIYCFICVHVCRLDFNEKSLQWDGARRIFSHWKETFVDGPSKSGEGMVAHTYNPSYPGGRDQEDCSSKLAQANSSVRPYLEKNPSQKRAGGLAPGIGPEFKPQYHQKKKVWGRGACVAQVVERLPSNAKP
jgi:hypothetical protein